MQQIFLRINTLDKTLRKRMDQGDREVDALRKLLSNLFGVLWEQPIQARLQAAKFLADRGRNQHYDLKKDHLSALNEYIQKTVPQYSPDIADAHRQTQDIVSRLTTYQASIET
ncbi:hypothetical protein PR002_g15581 [Phytophthora rubi]|uniref:Uncharacterized protein n=1 Tax=Phytophthora rubi TaxID=129364 RepID=A0A6A3L1C4_9STRA|nr:hypothetical protein PR002_g15581 [Phytophthora rubi]